MRLMLQHLSRTAVSCRDELPKPHFIDASTNRNYDGTSCSRAEGFMSCQRDTKCPAGECERSFLLCTWRQLQCLSGEHDLNFPDSETAPRPLENVTVLDLTTALAGPYATFLLACLGARVIKVENPLGPDSCRGNAPYLGQFGLSLTRKNEDDISISALNRLRNKEAITLNLKHPDAREVYADLVRKADMVVDNFSRGTLDRIGVGYEFARQMNPRIIYCSITGFGNQG
jgi:hypothetical protein